MSPIKHEDHRCLTGCVGGYKKEHSNIISSLRAQNEPLLCVTEIGMGVTEAKDETNDNGSAGKSRKKIKRNTSAPLPGMLQAPRKFLAPTLSDGPSRSGKENPAMGLKKRNPRLQASIKNLPNLSESEENSSSSADRNKPTGSGLGAKTGEVHTWWKDAFHTCTTANHDD